MAKSFDDRVTEMRGTFGEIGDMRLHVMAALMIADEVSEWQQKAASLQTELDALQGDAGAADRRIGEVENRAAEALAKAAERIATTKV